MSKPLLVVAISDEHYLFPLEIGVAEKLYQSVDIEVISDSSYFEEFFTSPRSIDLLIIDESFYDADLKRHNIKKTILLTEDLDDGTEEKNDSLALTDSQTIKVFKYLNLQVLMSSIIPAEWIGVKTNTRATQVIAVISAEGGSGCTVTALGICSSLRQSLKRTLYVNTKSFQDFHYYFQNKTTLSMQGCSKLRNVTPKIYVELKGELQQEFFTYLPPVATARYALGIPEQAYQAFVQAAQKSTEYDVIVVDMGNELTAENIHMLDIATKVLIISGQQPSAAFKLQLLLRNINCNDKEKFHFVCNRYDAASENAFTSAEYANVAKINEYIEILPKEKLQTIKGLSKIDGLQRIAYSLM